MMCATWAAVGVEVDKQAVAASGQLYLFITAEKGGVAKAKGEGEKKKDCTTECKPTVTG